MKKLLSLSCVLLMSVILTGCSTIKSKEIAAGNITEIVSEVEKSNLSSEDKGLFLGAYRRRPNSLTGKTVDEVIESERKIVEETKRVKAIKYSHANKMSFFNYVRQPFFTKDEVDLFGRATTRDNPAYEGKSIGDIIEYERYSLEKIKKDIAVRVIAGTTDHSYDDLMEIVIEVGYKNYTNVTTKEVQGNVRLVRKSTGELVMDRPLIDPSPIYPRRAEVVFYQKYQQRVRNNPGEPHIVTLEINSIELRDGSIYRMGSPNKNSIFAPISVQFETPLNPKRIYSNHKYTGGVGPNPTIRVLD